MNIVNLRNMIISCVVIMAAPTLVQAIDYTYVTNGNTITITQYTGTNTDVIIPDTITGLPVATIGQAAFSGSDLISVGIPTSITNIEQMAFMNCGSLTSITIPSSVSSIGMGAFAQCSNLTSVNLPRNLDTIAQGLLSGCANLASISIPNYVSVIEKAAFADCSSLTGIVLPNSVTTVMQDAFTRCSSLGSISIGTGLNTFDLTSSGLSLYGGPLLEGCNSLVTISVDKHNNYYSSDNGVLLNKDQTELIMCPARKNGSYTVPISVSSIGDSAFNQCEGLTNIVLPDGLESIGLAAFLSCSGITNMVIPNGVSFIDRAAFYDCTNLKEVTLPGGITSISSDLFGYCGSLIHITIPAGVTNIDSYAFENSSSLESIGIPDSVTHIGTGAFTACTTLKSMRIPSSVLHIEGGAFADCANLISVMFEGNAPLIGDGSPDASTSTYYNDPNVISFYLPGAAGWGDTYGDRPAVMWDSQMDATGASIGVQVDGFHFRITGATNLPITIEACTSLDNSVWEALQSVWLTNGAFNFSDDQWTNYPTRFYRTRNP